MKDLVKVTYIDQYSAGDVNQVTFSRGIFWAGPFIPPPPPPPPSPLGGRDVRVGFLLERKKHRLEDCVSASAHQKEGKTEMRRSRRRRKGSPPRRNP